MHFFLFFFLRERGTLQTFEVPKTMEYYCESNALREDCEVERITDVGMEYAEE